MLVPKIMGWKWSLSSWKLELKSKFETRWVDLSIAMSDLNDCVQDGFTPLHVACRMVAAVVSVLLAAGARTDVRDQVSELGVTCV
jgi:ankyrin repeat protein